MAKSTWNERRGYTRKPYNVTGVDGVVRYAPGLSNDDVKKLESKGCTVVEVRYRDRPDKARTGQFETS